MVAGWVPKRNIVGLNDRIFILDFFGSQKMRGTGLDVPSSRILTAFGSPWNPMLGFYVNTTQLNTEGGGTTTKENRGIIWGKDPKHFDGKESTIRRAASKCQLVATSTGQVFRDQNIKWVGHQSKNEWHQLLATSKFLLGLGDPLLGPSAIEAITFGCVYINPIYQRPMRDVFASQHPYAEKIIGHPYVCSYHVGNLVELEKCVDYALSANLPPFLPSDFEWVNYLKRVKDLFKL